MVRFWSILILPLLAAATCSFVFAEDRPDPPKPSSHTSRSIEGWTVRVDDRLLRAPDDALGQRALRLLEAKLAEIRSVVAPDRLAKLQSVTIVLDLTHGRLRSMQYHPSAEWLESHGYSKDLARCVHIPEAADFANPRHNSEQPWCVLHELTHAYHDQVLGFEEERISAAFERFRKSGHGDSTLHIGGKRTRHYALTDQKEFFAEMSEAYFGMNDFFPFNRAELMTAEPEVYELLRIVWGPMAWDAPDRKQNASGPSASTRKSASDRACLMGFRSDQDDVTNPVYPAHPVRSSSRLSDASSCHQCFANSFQGRSTFTYRTQDPPATPSR